MPYRSAMVFTSPANTSRNRWLALAGVRLLGSAGAVLGVVLIGRAHTTMPKVLGVTIVLAALYFIATVTGALAHHWRSGAE